MKKIVIFASGGGSNAQKIIEHFESSLTVKVQLILSNNAGAQVLDKARVAGIPAMSFNRYAFAEANSIQQLLNTIQPDLVVLAGFLWKIPHYMVADFPDQIINIHPALLPKYGGKGMYGMNVHKAVVANKELQSGITIHYVNQNYDEGATIFQATCDLEPNDTAIDVSQKVLRLEHQHFPQVIEKLLYD